MKRILVILTGILILNYTCSAQYSVNKKDYDFRIYTYQPGDPYNPRGAGEASALIPGLGQMICGEGARGAGFLLGWMGSLSIFIIGITMDYDERDPDFQQKITTQKVLCFSGLAGSVTFWIWSIKDAVKVAKVNNMAFRDKRKVQRETNIYPYIKYPSPLTNDRVPVGVSVCINF